MSEKGRVCLNLVPQNTVPDKFLALIYIPKGKVKQPLLT